MRRKYTRELFVAAVSRSNSIRELMDNLGMPSQHNNQYGRIRNFSIEYGVDISHLYLRNRLIQQRNRTRVQRELISDAELARAVAKVDTFYGVVRLLRLQRNNPSKCWVIRRVQELGLDTSHFDLDSYHKKKPFEVILVKNSPYRGGSSYLKGRLVKGKLLSPRCYICSIDRWQDEPLTLQLDHINGRRLDNRIENLRLLCPNCHSQTSTFCGRNVKNSLRHYQGY